ncbi:hypothetical protein ACTFIY_004581 [Dictyostelium cf. discoideum]
MVIVSIHTFNTNRNNNTNRRNNYNNNYYIDIKICDIQKTKVENSNIPTAPNKNVQDERLECQVPFEYIDVYGNPDFSFLKYTKRSEFRNYLKKAYNTECLFDRSFRFNGFTSLPTIKR